MSDLPRLLLLQYPVRCRSCRERDFTGLMLALNLRQAGRIRHLEDKARKNKQSSSAPKR
jgi:hypothetical protein